jgi:hypothetical protein
MVERRVGLDGQTRFVQPGTLRAFGIQALDEHREANAIHRALVAHVVSTTEAHQPDLRSDDPARALDRLEDDHATIRAALACAFDAGMAREGLRICTAVFGFWMYRDHLEEAIRWLERGLAVAGDEPTVERANAELLLGHAEPDVTRSTIAYERALAIYRSVGNDRNTAGALTSIGVAVSGSGGYGRAIVLLREAGALFEAMSRSPTSRRSSTTSAVPSVARATWTRRSRRSSGRGAAANAWATRSASSMPCSISGCSPGSRAG